MRNQTFLNTIEDTRITFDRKELELILRLYGRMVALGEWKDYGISMLRDYALFSIYRRASEHPIYRIKKSSLYEKKSTEIYLILAMDGTILKRGQDLSKVLRVLEKKLVRVVK